MRVQLCDGAGSLGVPDPDSQLSETGALSSNQELLSFLFSINFYYLKISRQSRVKAKFDMPLQAD